MRTIQHIRSRDEILDIGKGIGVITVLLAHSIQRGLVVGYQENIIFRIISSFHMPLFFLISGYIAGIRNNTFSNQWLSTRTLRLILPTFIWSYILYFCRGISFTGLYPHTNFNDNFIYFSMNLLIHPTSIIWFLYTLYISELAVLLSKKQIKSDMWLVVILLILWVIFAVIPNDYFGAYRLKYYFPYFVIGYYIAKHDGLIRRCWKSLLLILTFGLAGILVYNLFFVDVHWEAIQYAFRYWTAVSLSMYVYLLSLMIAKLQPLKEYMIWLSMHSLEIYLLQLLFLNIGIGNGMLRCASIFVTATIMSCMLANLIDKTKYVRVILFGKKMSRITNTM